MLSHVAVGSMGRQEVPAADQARLPLGEPADTSGHREDDCEHVARDSDGAEYDALPTCTAESTHEWVCR